MFSAYIIVTILTAAANTYAAVVDFRRPQSVLDNTPSLAGDISPAGYAFASITTYGVVREGWIGFSARRCQKVIAEGAICLYAVIPILNQVTTLLGIRIDLTGVPRPMMAHGASTAVELKSQTILRPMNWFDYSERGKRSKSTGSEAGQGTSDSSRRVQTTPCDDTAHPSVPECTTCRGGSTTTSAT
jgi:hypothetical protein